MELRTLINATRSVADTANGRAVAIIGNGLLIVDFAQTVDNWEASYQEYLWQQMAMLAEKMLVTEKTAHAGVQPSSQSGRRARTIDF